MSSTPYQDLDSLDGLTYGSAEITLETEKGIPRFNGRARGLVEWKAKIADKQRIANMAGTYEIRAANLAEFFEDIVDGLDEDVLVISSAMTGEQRAGIDAVDTLIAMIERHVLRFRLDEARALHREGANTTGELCRQRGEPIASHIARRRRWHLRLCSLGEGHNISEVTLCDYLVDCADITPAQRERLDAATGSRN